jgi:hypothetical protein
MILRPSPWKPNDLDLAPGYAALTELPRRRRRPGLIWLVGAVALSAAGLAILLIR